MAQKLSRRWVVASMAASVSLAKISRATARASSPGISADEIKLGTTAFYSGHASTAAPYGLAQVAYFRMINERGGINGRKVNLISLDNAFSPPKALEQTRKLVESDEVFIIAGSIGTPTNAAIQRYLNDKGVPNLFLTSGAEQFNNPSEFPWIVPFYPTFVSQGRLFAKFILHERASAKIAVQYENDDLGRDYLKGLKLGLGGMASQMIVRELSHELSDPTVELPDTRLQSVRRRHTSAVHAVEVCRTGNQGSVRPELASVAHRCFDRRLGRSDIYSGWRRGI